MYYWPAYTGLCGPHHPLSLLGQYALQAKPHLPIVDIIPTHIPGLQVELLNSIMGTRESAGLRSYSSLRPLHRIDNAQLYVHYQAHSVITKLAASASSLANAR